MRRFLSNYFDLLFETLLVLVGMGMGRNRDYFTGINGNWTIVEDLPTPGMGMGTKLWEWEHSYGNGREWDQWVHKKSFPHICSLCQFRRQLKTYLFIKE